MRHLATLLLVSALALPALADEPIKVIESSGNRIDNSGRTRIAFRGQAGTDVRQVMSSGQGIGTTPFGGFGSAYSETTHLLCRAPCTVEVPNGIYELRASDNMVFGDRFTVVADGSPQSWELQDANAGLGVFGILGTGLGLGGAIGGGMMLALNINQGEYVPMGTALTVGGSALTALGLWALIAAFADAEPAS